MGCCFSRDQHSIADSEEFDGQITIGKNRPLIQERLKWRSEMALTEGQLRSKRDEFWETAPAFEGRREIWDALKAATTLAEQGDWELAQAILDGANISLPDGTLRDSYDELGNRYQVPIYCLFNPINLIEKESESSVTSGNQHNNQDVSLVPPPGGKLVTLKLRLSTKQNDLKIDAKTTETVLSVKKRLSRLVEDLSGDPRDQRWYYGGRYLSDKMTIENCRIPAGFVVQIIMRAPEEPITVVNLLTTPSYPSKDTVNNNEMVITEETAMLPAQLEEPRQIENSTDDHPKAHRKKSKSGTNGNGYRSDTHAQPTHSGSVNHQHDSNTGRTGPKSSTKERKHKSSTGNSHKKAVQQEYHSLGAMGESAGEKKSRDKSGKHSAAKKSQSSEMGHSSKKSRAGTAQPPPVE